MGTPASAPPIAELVELSKRYPGADGHAVKGLTLELRSGEFFSLLGPSGCGKSTTLRLVAGLEQQSSGAVRIDGVDMAGRPANRRPTNMVFQHLGLFPHLDVAHNVGFGLRVRRVPKAQRRAEVARVLELVELSGYQRRFPDQLSGGQQQRVAIARALANRPAVLLLDEPLASLDLKLRQQMQEVLRELQRTSGTTFLFVTHDQTEAMTLSDRIGIMEDGRLRQVGTAESLYRRPASRFVARFIGDANLLDVPVTDGVARIDDQPVRVAQARSGAAVSVRPEDIRLSEDTSGAEVVARIVSATYLGATVRYELATRSGLRLRALRAANTGRLAIGEHAAVTWRPEDAVVLPD